MGFSNQLLVNHSTTYEEIRAKSYGISLFDIGAFLCLLDRWRDENEKVIENNWRKQRGLPPRLRILSLPLPSIKTTPQEKKTKRNEFLQ